MVKTLFTSESVTEGHPDKLCDRVSDAVLDAILKEDPTARVACETFCTTGIINVMGEINTSCYVDIPDIARKVVCDIGYDNPDAGFDGNTCAVVSSIGRQSPDIAMGVDNSLEYKANAADEYDRVGAGDQGMMFGFACNDTKELMPLPVSLAHKLAFRLAEVRKNGTLSYLRPDGKTQVTVEYHDEKPARVHTVVVSAQHNEEIDMDRLKADIKREVIDKIIPQNLMDSETIILINPTGRFVIGGPVGDTGLTGRKIIVDTYGGMARHGGGAFSGKDPTKVDRSAAYAARYVAKNIVAAGIAEKCEVQLAYSIGVARPVSVAVNTFGTGKADDEKIANAVNRVFDLRPAAIIDKLNLRRPIYGKTTNYGHFGREDQDFTWEKTDKTEELKTALGV